MRGSKIVYWKQLRGLLSTIASAAGLMPTASLGSGTADATTFLRGDQTYAALPVASAIATGVITIGTQSIAGFKTFERIAIVGTSDIQSLDITPFATQTLNQQIWRTTAGTQAAFVDAAGRFVLGSNSFTVSSSFHCTMWQNGAYGWASSSVNSTTVIDTGLYRDGGVGLVAARFGSTPHDVRVYNTWTSVSVYERGSIGFQSNVFTIGSYAAGGGTLRDIMIGVSGNKIGFLGTTAIAKPTTAFTTATFVANAGTAVNDASTFDGYTIKQVVAALRAFGLLT